VTAGRPDPVRRKPPTVVKPDPSVMTLVEHLSELRRRVAISLLAVLVPGIVGFWKAPDIIVLLLQPLPGGKVVFLSPGSGFMLWLKIAIVVGILIGLPVILYQLWAFIAPGLTAKERREVRPLLPFSVFFFALGLAVAYVTLPYAIAFLAGFQIEGRAELFPTAEAYFGFVTMLFVVFGAVMEFPLVLVLLSKMHILSVDKLRASRRFVLLGIVLFAVVVTPGGDPVSPTIMTIVMYLLYEFTIFFLRRQEAAAAAIVAADDADGTDAADA
jgi:sec-independent protein translocase protein TatC